MPGIVVFKRRWSVGSDDFVVPAVLLFIIHTIWLIALAIILGVIHFEPGQLCTADLENHVVGFIIILSLCLLVEGLVAVIAMQGGILDQKPRIFVEYLLYTRVLILLGEVVWLVIGVIWIIKHFESCSPIEAKEALLGIVVTNWLILFTIIVSLWCTFDSAGRKWVVMKRYQDSLKDRRAYKHSGSTRRNWRQSRSTTRDSLFRKWHTKAMRAYEESWDRRFKVLCCCVQRKGRNRNSITEVAQLFTDFFRDLDVVPSDVVAGLVLLRHHQKLLRVGKSRVYQYLSGVPVTPTTRFLELHKPDVLEDYRKVVHYMKFALAAYGWPATVRGSGLCAIVPYLSCCCIHCCAKRPKYSELIGDNCCHCNYAALKKLSGLKNVDIIYVTYHVDIGETPFYVAIDHTYKKVVICVRGTLSLQDVLTDLNAEAEVIPLTPEKSDWFGHKGMVQAAVYIDNKIEQQKILEHAFSRVTGADAKNYDVVLVGHSLGAGTAAILAILMKQRFPSLHCYSYSPPGGLLSDICVEETKSYITSVVVAKDVVPRIGLSQMESLRTDLINVIKASDSPKWKIITHSLLCCCPEKYDVEANKDEEVLIGTRGRDVTAHPSDSMIGLTAHRPLFPPGTIIHIVRKHQDDSGFICGRNGPVYQAIWADTTNFDEVLISPTMINDHMPDNVLEALEKVLVNDGPIKPNRILSEEERRQLLTQSESPSATPDASPSAETPDITLENTLDSEVITVDQGNVTAINMQTLACDQQERSSPASTLKLSLEKSPNKLKTDFPEVLSLPHPVSDNSLSWDQAAVDNMLTMKQQACVCNVEPIVVPDDKNSPIEQQDPDLCPPLASPEGLSDSSLSRNSSAKVPQPDHPGHEECHESIEHNKVDNVKGKTNSDSIFDVISDKNDSGISDMCIDANKVSVGSAEFSRDKSFSSSEKGSSRESSEHAKLHTASDLPTMDSVDDYYRHEPTGNEQFEYDHPNTFYSAADTGYPHGLSNPYQEIQATVHSSPVVDTMNDNVVTPSVQTQQHNNEAQPKDTVQNASDLTPLVTEVRKQQQRNEASLAEVHTHHHSNVAHPKLPVRNASESQLNELAAQYVMKRSNEETDLAHLQDDREIYCSDKNNKSTPNLHSVKSVPHTLTSLNEEDDLQTPDSGLDVHVTGVSSDFDTESSV